MCLSQRKCQVLTGVCIPLGDFVVRPAPLSRPWTCFIVQSFLQSEFVTKLHTNDKPKHVRAELYEAGWFPPDLLQWVGTFPIEWRKTHGKPKKMRAEIWLGAFFWIYSNEGNRMTKKLMVVNWKTCELKSTKLGSSRWKNSPQNDIKLMAF